MEKIINLITIAFTLTGGTVLLLESKTTVAFLAGILLLAIAAFLMIALEQTEPKVKKDKPPHPGDSLPIPEKQGHTEWYRVGGGYDELPYDDTI